MIGEDGEQLGVVPTPEALQIARDRGLDLVEVAPTAVPPVARLLDYGRFKYEQEKKDREARKNQKTVLMKEVRLRPKTSVHDVDFKVGHIRGFLSEGHRVKVSVFFRGRSITHPELGKAMLDRIADKVADVASVDQQARMEGRSMSMMLIAK